MSDALAPSPEYANAGRRVEFAYAPQGPTLEEYILSDEQRTMIQGPLGSGKTNASCWKGMRIMRSQEPDRNGVRKVRGCAVRNTYPDLFGTTIKDWLEMFGDPGMGTFKQGGKEPPTHHLKFRLPDKTTVDAEMIFMALDREEHVKKLRGFQGTFGWVNEVKELPKAIVDMLDLRMGRYPVDVPPTWYGIFGDTNAPDTDHWYYRLAEEMRPEGWKFLRQPGGLIRQSPQHPWVENPAAENIRNLPKGYYIRGAQGKSESWIRVNLGNEYGYVGDGMPVWPEYVDTIHCRPFELVPGIPIDIGLDFGLTPAAIIGQQLPTGQYRWRYEVVTTDTGIGRFARLLKAFIASNCKGFKIRSITGDPAGDQRQVGDSEERTVFALLAAEGVHALPAPGNNDFALRSEAVALPLRTMIDGQPGLLIHPDMKVTRIGMQGGYKFRRLQVAGDERYQLEPLKNKYSHPCEAGQYLQLGAGGTEVLLLPNSAARAADAAAFRNERALPANDNEARAFRRARGLR